MKFCIKCGRQLPDDVAFCFGCGAPMPNSESDRSASATPGEKTGQPSSVFQTELKPGIGYGTDLENLPAGYVIEDRFEVKEKLGQGGFGAVYRAYDRKMDIEKALKVLPRMVAEDRETMDTLLAEARTMARLNHANIVRLYEFHDKGAVKCLDMEYVAGGSLADKKFASQNKRLSEEEVRNTALQIADSLAYAHNLGVIHKDIKPQNMLIAKDGTVKVMDFGISETLRSSLSRLSNTTSSGSLAYMSPEQVRGKDVGPEADIYSFGAMLYELLSGHPPFYKGAIEHQILNEQPEPIEGVSDEMNGFLLICLKKDYHDRFRSFEKAKEALKQTITDAYRSATPDASTSEDTQRASVDSLQAKPNIPSIPDSGLLSASSPIIESPPEKNEQQIHRKHSMLNEMEEISVFALLQTFKGNAGLILRSMIGWGSSILCFRLLAYLIKIEETEKWILGFATIILGLGILPGLTIIWLVRKNNFPFSPKRIVITFLIMFFIFIGGLILAIALDEGIGLDEVLAVALGLGITGLMSGIFTTIVLHGTLPLALFSAIIWGTAFPITFGTIIALLGSQMNFWLNTFLIVAFFIGCLGLPVSNVTQYIVKTASIRLNSAKQAEEDSKKQAKREIASLKRELEELKNRKAEKG